MTTTIVNGEWIEYSDDKLYKYQWNFKDGKYHWYWVLYYENQVYFEWEFKEWNFKNGKRYNDPWDPFWIIYDGEFNDEEEKHWHWKLIHLGKLYYEWEFQHNEIYGKWKLYDENGILAYDGDFFEARREWHGKYYIDGILVYEWEWKDWRPLTPREWYDEEKENQRYENDLCWRFRMCMTALCEHRKGTICP